MLRTPIAFLALCITLAFSSCASTEDGINDGSWVETEVRAPSLEVLWQVTEYSLRRQDFPVQNRFDSANPMATSGWFVSLAPFKGQGFRERARVRYETLGQGEYLVGTRVERESNECLAKPLDISYAKWKPDADNEGRAKILLHLIRGYLGDDSEFEVGEKPTPFR